MCNKILIEFDVLPAYSRVLVTVDCYAGFMVLKTVAMKVLSSGV
jgi:hypothetical protein